MTKNINYFAFKDIRKKHKDKAAYRLQKQEEKDDS